MIISDLSHLEVVSEAESLEGGCGQSSYYGWYGSYGDYQSNSSSIGQCSGDSVTQQLGLVNVNASSNNIAIPVQANVNHLDVL